jgi:hypothetical protein
MLHDALNAADIRPEEEYGQLNLVVGNDVCELVNPADFAIPRLPHSGMDHKGNQLYSTLSWDQFAELIGGEVIEIPDIDALAAALGDSVEMERGGDMVAIRLNHGQIGGPAPHVIIRADNTDGHGALTLIAETNTESALGLKTMKEQVDTLLPIKPGDFDVANPERKICGFTKQQLSDAFDLIKDQDDWKAPISANIPVDKFEVAAAACTFYTSTHLFYEEADELGTFDVSATGYRMGPAGDH